MKRTAVVVASAVTSLWLATSAVADPRGVERAPVQAAWPASGTVRVGFTPWDDVEHWVVDELGTAQSQVLVHAYTFTSYAIARALIAAHRRGVDVRVLADRMQAIDAAGRIRDDSRLPELQRAGIEVAYETRYAAAHNKVLVIDVQTAHPRVMTGSYNWTHAAQARNAENLVLVRDDPVLARRYADNWHRQRRDAVLDDPHP